MKLIFNKYNLINSINISLKAIPSRSINEINNCIHIRAYNEIYFTTSDEELWIKTLVEGNIIKNGEIAVNARLLSDIIKKLPTDEIIMEVENNLTTIKSGTAKFKIPSISLEGYSDIPDIEDNYKMSISSLKLKEAIRKTIFSTSSMESQNYLMSGEFLEIEDNVLKMTATDGGRVAIIKQLLDKQYPYKSCIIPAKTLSEISKILTGENDDNINIIITDNHILFNMNTTLILSRLLSGKYFDMKRMLSSDYELNLNINRLQLLDSVDRSVLLSRESDNNPLILKIKEELNLSIKSRIGEMKESIDIKKSNEKQMAVGLNPKFLLDVLKVIDDENIDVFFINKIAPIFIKDKEENYIYILLPVNFIDEEEYGN